MAKYMIHSCNSRQWYVDQYLVPSMLEQGISEDDIMVWQDKDEQGNLKMFISSLEYLEDKPYGVWHLQDDVCICHDFKKRTEELDEGVVAGFCSSYDTDIYFGTDKTTPTGWVNIEDLWFSFCCMRIPEDIVKEYLYWWKNIAVNDGEVIRICINEGKNDDYAFRLFVKNYYKGRQAYNCKPNLVNHIDYLIGGSLLNKRRGNRDVSSIMWEDDYIIEELKEQLQKITLQ